MCIYKTLRNTLRYYTGYPTEQLYTKLYRYIVYHDDARNNIYVINPNWPFSCR